MRPHAWAMLIFLSDVSEFTCPKSPLVGGLFGEEENCSVHLLVEFLWVLWVGGAEVSTVTF